MKNNWKVIVGLLLLGCGLAACTGSSYSKLLKAEKELIANYISRNNLEIVDELPTDSAFLTNEKLYYRVPGYDHFYYRLEKRGDTISDAVRVSQEVSIRYKEYTLQEYPDTVSNWSTLDSQDPVVFSYMSGLNTSNPTVGVAWHVATGLMEYSGSECKIICPSKLNITTHQYSVTPYGYILAIKFHP